MRMLFHLVHILNIWICWRFVWEQIWTLGSRLSSRLHSSEWHYTLLEWMIIFYYNHHSTVHTWPSVFYMKGLRSKVQPSQSNFEEACPLYCTSPVKKKKTLVHFTNFIILPDRKAVWVEIWALSLSDQADSRSGAFPLCGFITAIVFPFVSKWFPFPFVIFVSWKHFLSV